MAISIDSSGLDRAIARVFVTTQESANDIVDYAANRFVTEVAGLTIRGAGRRQGAGLAASVAAAKREHTEYLREHILKKRLRRWGSFSRPGRLTSAQWQSLHLSRKESKKYFAVAKRRQGELAAGWNAAAQATKAKVPSFVKKHGLVHGTYAKRVFPDSVISEIRWGHHKGDHGNMKVFSQMALKNVIYKLENTKTKLVAANIRKHAAKRT